MTTVLTTLILILAFGLTYWTKRQLASYRFENFLIRRGNHRSKFAWHPTFKNTLSVDFIFSGSARYDIGDKQDSLNKLIGFSDGGLNHHENSFRLAWRYDKERDLVELYSYTYVNGERQTSHIFYCGIHEPINVSITCRPSIYRVAINGYIVYHPRRSSKVKSKYKHMLWPYFGGTEVAPHSISILMRWVWKKEEWGL